MLKNFALSGYRSFGPEIQHFERLRKINLFIGPNNSGKSNILRFVKLAFDQQSRKIEDLDFHIDSNRQIVAATGQSIETESGIAIINGHSRFSSDHFSSGAEIWSALRSIYDNKSFADQSELAWSKWDLQQNHPIIEDWIEPIAKAVEEFDAYEQFEFNEKILLRRFRLTDKDNGVLYEIATKINCNLPNFHVHFIPAVREINAFDPNANILSGSGLIDRIAKLQNPDITDQKDRQRFHEIRNFLRAVTESQEAEIEIPHSRKTIIAHMNGRSLPIESLGSGIHEVIILAAAATVIQDSILCIEEPELHLNPILQRKLIRYLKEHTSNQYFIATHSHVLMDTPDAEIYRVRLEEGKSKVERVTSGRSRRQVCEDLGYHPSDLLQSNCIVWVEGPSDRIYLNHWLSRLAPDLQEQVHYSIMFYGGRLASHLSNADLEVAPEDLISLRRLNSRSCILIDSDKASADARINATKQRLQSEFDTGPGFAWVTAGREIENYLDSDQLDASIRHSRQSSTPLGQYGQFDNPLKITNSKGELAQANKVDVARHYVQQIETDPFPYDLQEKLDRLIAFIRDSSPTG